jgi:HK97 family phage major capsid protein
MVIAPARLCPPLSFNTKRIDTKMRNISNLQNRKSKLLADAQVLVDAGLRTAEQKAEYKKLVDEATLVQSDIDALARIERAMPSLPTAPAPVASPVIEVVPESPEKRRAKLNAAARSFFKHGANSPQFTPEHRAILTTSDTSGGALVSQAFDDVFLESSLFYGPIWNLIHRKDTTSGNPVKFVTTDPTNQTFSLITTEGSTSTSGVAQQPTMLSNITDTDTLVSSFIYSTQEASDAFDLTEFLTRNAGLAVSRAREQSIVNAITNDGSATALPSSPSGGLLAAVTAGVTQTGGTLAAGITYAQLSALAGSVDRSYYATGAFMASPSVETFLRSQVSTTGKPLYKIGDDGLLIIAGRKLFPCAAMPANGTASSKLVLFGDYSKAYSVLNAGVRIKIIGNDESPALTMLTREAVIWTRLGAAAGVSNAVKALVSAAD